MERVFDLFGKNLKRLRTNAKLTQQELATKLKVAPSTIGMYESGKRMPDTEILNKLANMFNVSIDYLLGRETQNITSDSIVLNQRDKRDIAKDVASIMNKIKNNEDGPTYYNGVAMDEEDAELFEQALEFALKSIKIENKEKYTPKKYRK